MTVTRWILLTPDYPPYTGGVARYLGELVTASSGGIEVIVPNEHPVGVNDFVRRGQFSGGWPVRWWSLVGLIRSLNAEKNNAPRLLVSHILPIGTAAWIASFFGGPTYTILFHGLDLHLTQSSSWKRWLTKQIVKRANGVIVNSEYVARECRRCFPKAKPLVLTPGYSPHELPAREVARTTLGVRTSETILLSVCRLIPRKGIDRVVEALVFLPADTRLVVVGDGSDRVRLERLSLELGVNDRVSFVGAIEDEVRDRWYAAADVFVLPVRDDGADIEGYGIVCLEAAAAGLPVVVGHGGGASETVQPGITGYVVDADQDATELVQTLQTLIQDPTLRQKMGEAGRERVLRDHPWVDRWNQLRDL